MGKDFDRNFSKEYVEMTNDHMKRCSVSLAISSVQSLSHAWCFATPCTAGFPVYHQFLELDQIHVHRVGDAIHLCGPFSSCLQSLPASGSFIALRIRWPKYWSFSFSISPSNEYSELISFRIDWLDLLVVQWTLKSLLQHHSSKASIL